MSAETLLRRAFEAFNADDFSSMEETFDPEIEFSPHLMRLEGATFHGYAGMLTYNRLRHEVWERLEVEFEDCRAGTEIAVAVGRIRVQGRASGVAVEGRIVWICRIRDGRLLSLVARRADDPGEIALALEEAGLPADAFEPTG